MADIRDILELDRPLSPEITKEIIFGTDKQKKKTTPNRVQKRPEGMHREVFALLCTDNKDGPPLFPTDTGQGYKQVKAQLGMRRARSWRWMDFSNTARTDGALFKHWRRAEDEGKEYPFAKFNKQVDVPTYNDVTYSQHLQCGSWSKDETDHLFDLCRRFDTRFIIIHDRWDRSRFMERSVEDLKERYYDVYNTLAKVRAVPGQDPKLHFYDADHERRRKEQLRRLFDRTPEQIEEEQYLINELRKIEARKREREKKQQDLQKLITAADSAAAAETRKSEKKITKKKFLHPSRPRGDCCSIEMAGIKFPDLKGSGVTVRSSRMKLPASVGQKKIKAIEQLLNELNIEMCPIPTEPICSLFNELRSNMVLLYELKTALATCDFELQTLRHQYEALNPGKTLVLPSANPNMRDSGEGETTVQQRGISEIIDVVGSPGPSTYYSM
ncbi:DNA methyltransferase 1-associated protein 1 isoform X2 [Anabrus simplex]